MILIIVSVLFIGTAGLLLGLIVASAAKKFAVKTDPRIDEVTGLLPGANCGGCGCAGCADFAKKIVLENAPSSSCVAVSDEARGKIDLLLGRESSTVVKKVAVVCCSGSNAKAKRIPYYNGILDCRSANTLAGGGKACRFGCLGYGSCTRACPFGAIEIIDGLAVVHPELCTGCGTCAVVCPRKLIRLVPASQKVHVFCNSLQKPALKLKNCAAGCMNCRKCDRSSPGKMQILGSLVRINEADPPGEEILDLAKCPSKCLQTPEGHLKMILERSAKHD